MNLHMDSAARRFAVALVLVGSVAVAQTPPPRPDPAALFQRLDANGDGELNGDEFKQLATLGEGRLKDRPEVFDRIFGQLDADHSGGLSQDEFQGLSEMRARGNPQGAPSGRDSKVPSSTAKPMNPESRGVTAPKAGLPKLYKFDPGPHEVESVPELALHDGRRDKALQLRVSFPSGPGPFPIIIFSHGATGSKDDYQPLVRHWVSHGYVCIQANHSDSRALAGMSETGKVANKFGDWPNRPKDIVFLLDSLDAIEAQIPGLKGKMDKTSVGVGGHSFGAHTAQLVAGTTTVDSAGARTRHADARPMAFVMISPQGKGPQLDDRAWVELKRPFLSVTGSKDWGRNGDPVDWRLDPFRLAASREKYLLFIEGAQHDFGGMGGGVQYRNAGPANPNYLAYVRSTTTAFWDAFLKGDPKARAFLDSGSVEELSEGEARLTKGSTQ